MKAIEFFVHIIFFIVGMILSWTLLKPSNLGLWLAISFVIFLVYLFSKSSPQLKTSFSFLMMLFAGIFLAFWTISGSEKFLVGVIIAIVIAGLNML
ncbi:MAG: hypothetical protein HY364_04850 [Candidatus Aenigmarchaeota archaeon]|nr:hypothetical protein [Candidatus Aenigmarchaeota archaeon]